MGGLALLDEEGRASQSHAKFIQTVSEVFEGEVRLVGALLLLVADEFQFSDNFEHLHFAHGGGHLVDPLVLALQSGLLPNSLNQVGLKLGLVHVEAIKEVLRGDHVCIQGAEGRHLHVLCDWSTGGSTYA